MLQYLEKQSGVKIVIDYFSCTFPLKVQEDELELIVVEDLVKFIGNTIGFDNTEILKEEYATGRYKYQYTIGQTITIRLGGPLLLSGYKSCQIELRGQGCREVESRSSLTWVEFFDLFLLRLDGSPTRIDIAIDDYDGDKATLPKIKEVLDKRNYVTSFRKKYYKLMGCDEDGWSIQFGSHKSTMMFVIYDKLKEQLSKGNEVDQEFWTRYEMRFMKEKAYNVVMNLTEVGMEGFNNYCYGLLYSMLDLKSDNGYSEHNMGQAETIPWWSDFLGNVSKSEITKYKVKRVALDSYKEWFYPLLSTYLLLMFVLNGEDVDAIFTSMLEESMDNLVKLDKKKVKNINVFLDEVGQKKIGMDKVQIFLDKVKKYTAMKKLPF